MIASTTAETGSKVERDPLLARLLRLIDEAGTGGRIPPERELSERWSTSRTALRTRLRMLEALGALERRGSAGTFARVMEPSDVAAALEIGLAASSLSSAAAFESVRVALEREAAKKAAEVLRPVPLGYAEEAVLRMEATDDPEELYRADLDFHRALFQASGNTALIFFSEAVGDLIAASVSDRRTRMSRLAADTEEMRSLHRAIVDAIRSGDSSRSMTAVDRHFDRINSLSGEHKG